MTFTYEQEIDFELNSLKEREPEPFTFLLRSDDLAKKEEITEGMARGKKYRIVPPYRIVEGSTIFLPILEESNESA